jgi:diguanylate cyclase
LWHAVRRKSRALIFLSAMAGLLFLLLLAAYLLLDIPLYWITTAVLCLSLSGFADSKKVIDEGLEQVNQAALEQGSASTVVKAPQSYVEQSPLASFADKQKLHQGYYTWRSDTSLQAALVIIRLECFEQVNQHIGRDFGDLLLARSANRIKGALAHNDVIPLAHEQKLAHLGGLNFAFICSLASDKHVHEKIIKQILAATSKPFNVANCTIEVKIRASYIHCDKQDDNFEKLISNAYLALDSQPKQQVVAYHQKMMTDQLERQARLKELANIDFSSELELYFQPVIRNDDGSIEFLELLLRWQHPKQGILSASRFIADIRIAGIAYPLATFIIQRAAKLAKVLQREGFRIPLSINVFGPEMLSEEFVEFVASVISEYQLKAGDLIVECPLHIFLNLDDKGRAMVARLNNIGLKVCVDGLGDSPILLSKLPNLAVEYIKVAPSLTADFSNQNNIRSLVGGMVEMHNQQKTKVIFEGIETLDQLKFVKSLNAHAAQGYYFGHPLSSIGLTSWLKHWQLAQQQCS